LLVSLSFPVALHAATTLEFDWGPSPSGNIARYQLFQRLSNQNYNYSNPIWQGTSTGCVVTISTDDQVNHFVVKAVAVDGQRSANSNEETYTPPPPSAPSPAPPAVTTSTVNNIGSVSATGRGRITSLGVPNPTAHGVVWNRTGSPTLADARTNEGAASATGAFTSVMNGLTADTTYYVRAYATNSAATVYGGQVSFKTEPSATQPTPPSQAPPAVTTSTVNNIGSVSATGRGRITSLGVPNPTAHGVVWNRTGSPTLADARTNEGAASATGAFTSTMNGLTADTTYYVRAYATNSVATVYGGQVSFKTEPSATQPTPPPSGGGGGSTPPPSGSAGGSGGSTPPPSGGGGGSGSGGSTPPPSGSGGSGSTPNPSPSKATNLPELPIHQNWARNYPGTDISSLLRLPAGNIDPKVMFFVNANGWLKSAMELIVDQFKFVLADSGIKATSDGKGRLRIRSPRLDPFEVSVQIDSVVTTQRGDGLAVDGKGHFLLSIGNVCLKLVPTVFCEDQLKASLAALGLNRYSVEDGMLIVNLNDSEKMVLRFDPLANACTDNPRTQAKPAFSMVGNFCHKIDIGKLRLNFADGSYQNMPPSVFDWQQLSQALSAFGVESAVDPCNGIVTLRSHDGSLTWKGKPDYLYRRDRTMSASFTGFKPAGDLNGDGVADFYFCNNTWKQVFYTLPQP
jgi:hypothetical protein